MVQPSRKQSSASFQPSFPPEKVGSMLHFAYELPPPLRLLGLECGHHNTSRPHGASDPAYGREGRSRVVVVASEETCLLKPRGLDHAHELGLGGCTSEAMRPQVRVGTERCGQI